MRSETMDDADTKKVELSELVFTMNWEDPALDRAAFGAQPGAKLATVCSGACNTLEFLLDDPALVFAFDYNPSQAWVLELKAACFKELEHGEMLELMGVRDSTRRESLLDAVSSTLSPEARDYWRSQEWLLTNGLLNGGRYEQFVGKFNALLRLIQGRSRIEDLFQKRDRDERARFYEERWDNWRWRALFKLFFNKTILARRGLSADYFHFDDGSSSFAESFSRRTKHALIELPVQDNYFLAQYVRGRYPSDECLPAYLRPENFETIRSRIEVLEVSTGDVRDVFERFEPAFFDGICLTNVFELMSEEDTSATIPGVARVLKPGARMTLRNLMIPRSVPDELADELVFEEELSDRLHTNDRSFVYRSFQVYTRSG
jgi:S-adenosylmethionine-diacylglycerol 3-amino-3-carboxypropyl transferase